MLRVLYPINLDRSNFPVSTSLRELTFRNSQIDFYSFSQPITDEDKTLGQDLWGRPHIHKISTLDVLKQSFDIVHHASATDRNLMAASLAKTRSLGKCVHLFTAPIQPHTSDRYYKQYVESVQRADILAAVSHAVADDIKAKFGRTVDAVIPSGVDLNFFCPSQVQSVDSRQWGITKPYVLTVGIVTPRKRPDIVMKVASLLPDVDFVMAGGFYNTEEEDSYHKVASEHPNVKLLGAVPRSQVRALMAGAVALLFPSELEGLPLTVLEASAMGLPILAQPKSSMPEAVIEDVTGWMFSEDDLSVWAEKLRDIQNWLEKDRSKFAQQARAFVTENYSWDLVARQYGELYAKVANSN